MSSPVVYYVCIAFPFPPPRGTTKCDDVATSLFNDSVEWPIDREDRTFPLVYRWCEFV